MMAANFNPFEEERQSVHLSVGSAFVKRVCGVLYMNADVHDDESAAERTWEKLATVLRYALNSHFALLARMEIP